MRLITLLAIAGLTLALVHAGPGDESVAADQFKHSYIWAADPEHSSIMFQTGHWGIVDVVGWFEGYEIAVHSSKLDFSDAVVEARIDPARLADCLKPDCRWILRLFGRSERCL
jgi:polyisoprenoid-binding protein YceI